VDDEKPPTPHQKRRLEYERQKLISIGKQITNMLNKQQSAQVLKDKEDAKKAEKLEEQKNRRIRRELRCKLNKVLKQIPQR
jgi:phosphate uptake regulator